MLKQRQQFRHQLWPRIEQLPLHLVASKHVPNASQMESRGMGCKEGLTNQVHLANEKRHCRVMILWQNNI